MYKPPANVFHIEEHINVLIPPSGQLVDIIKLV